MVRRHVIVVLVLAVVLAGCGATDGDAGTTPTETTDENGAGPGADTDAPDDPGSGAGVWEPYEFSEGEFYEYEVHEAGERLGTFSWEVLSASGGTVTVRSAGEIEGESFETTASGTPETVYTGLLGSPAGGYVILGLYAPFVGAFRGESLAVGEGWSYSDGANSVSYRVERTDRIAGRDVFVTVIREDGDPLWETWIDAELAFAAKTVVYDEGEVETEVALTEYRPPN